MFLYGFKGKRLGRQQLESSALVRCLELEFARRLLGAMQECYDAGFTEIGIGGTIRSSATQRAGFLRSHRPIQPGEVPPKSCVGCVLDGIAYVLLPKTAHKAKPGSSCHERLMAPFPEVVTAADMVGAHRHIFATVYAPRWGLVDFGKVNGEIWHIQPADLPRSRSKFRPSMFPLKRWPREEDEVSKLCTLEGDTSPWLATGTVLQRCSEESAAYFRRWPWYLKSIGQFPRSVWCHYPCPAGDLGPFTPADFDQPDAVA